MNYLIIGNGGREYAILKSLSKNINNNYYYYGSYINPGINKYAQYIDNLNIETLKKYNINIVIIGPEKYLYDGLVNHFEDLGIKCIGPLRELAKIETSKSFARKLMTDNNMQNYLPRYRIFDNNNHDYEDFIRELKDYVIKADGLHGGKGVKVSGEDFKDINSALEYCQEIQKCHEKILIEEKLFGNEFSIMSFVDNVTCKHMPPVKDYKRLYNNDQGPNTGSMGSISYANHMLPFLDQNDINLCHNINESIIKHLNWEIGRQYCGILYGSFIKTKDGIKIIEFNARFGDPECINILEILETDLSHIFEHMINGKLNQLDIQFKNQTTCCRYLVPNGYPENPVKNHEIYIDERCNQNNIIYAGISKQIKGNETYLYEIGSRTIAVVGVSKNLYEANKIVEEQTKFINGPLIYRTDIGKEITYESSGVNIKEGNKVIRQIRKYVESTFNNNVVSHFGDFAGMYQLDNKVLVTSTDGVGTKSILVLEKYDPKEGYEMLGHDIVNHCVNDILVKGAKPLFFLDYYASNKIDANYVEYFVKGISDACREVGCVLIGGETAEMPDIYLDDKCDIVGTIVGVVDKDKIINGKNNVEEGDLIIGFPSSGPHTNGYSLIRKIVEDDISKDIIDGLCASHKCYYNDVMKLIEDGIEIHGLCHITGGGWADNPSRVLPDDLVLNFDKFIMTDIFNFIQEKSKLDQEEMLTIFNCGTGMIALVKETETALKMDNIMGKVIKMSPV